jgi:hypothetical protein
MAQTAKSIIISKFEAGDRPTDQDFLNLFDSILFINNVGSHVNGLSGASTSIEGDFTVQGDLAIGGSSTLSLGEGNLSIGNTAENVNSPFHGYTDEDEPVMYASASISDVIFRGISGDSTSSIKLEDDTGFAQFGTHTEKAFISVAGHEYFNITGSNLGPHSFFSGSVGIGSVANANASEKFKILDADTDVTAHLQTSKADGVATIGFQNDTQTYTFGVRDNDDLTIVNATGTPFKVKSNASDNNLVLDNGKVGIGLYTPTYPLHIETSDDSVAFFKSTDDGPTYIRIDTSTADADTHSAVLFMEGGSIKGATGYNADDNTINLVYATGINSNNGINIDSNGQVGIGTSSPSSLLHLKDTINDVSLQLESTKTDGQAFIRFIGDTGSPGQQHWRLGLTTLNSFTLYDNTGTGTPFTVEAGASSHTLYVDSNGRVGIGTGTPSEKLTVEGNISASGAINTLSHITASGNISASEDISGFTGSFHHVIADTFEGDGSNLTNLPAAAISSYTNNGDNRVLTSVNASEVNAEANLIFDGTNLGVGTASPSNPLHVESATDTIALFKTTDAGPTYIRIDTSAADTDTHSAIYFLENGSIKGATGYNAETDTVNLLYSTGINSTVTNGININSSGQVGIGTNTPGEKLSLVGNFAIRNDDDIADVITFKNTDTPSTTADILFKGSALITAEDGLTMAINSTGGNASFQIKTGDPQLGGEGTSNTSTIATFATGSVGSGLILHGDGSTKPGQLYFGNQETLNTTGSDAARIKFTTTDSEGNYYASSTADFLVFEKLDSQTSPDGGILFTNNGGNDGSSPETVAMAIRGDGDIGIGHISPSTTLHLKSPNNRISLFESTTNDQQAYITINSSNAGTDTHSYVYFNEGSSGKGAVGYQANADTIALVYDNGIASTNGINITSGGNVGIGTSNPGYALDVYESAADAFIRLRSDASDSAALIRFKNDAREYSTGISENDDFVVYDANSGNVPFKIEPGAPASTIVALSNGNVGIGKSSPGEKLHISGGKMLIQDTAVVWDDETPGTTRGSIHLSPQTNTGTEEGLAITFGSQDAGTGNSAQAGIYTITDGSDPVSGVDMYLGVADSFITGPQMVAKFGSDKLRGINFSNDSTWGLVDSIPTNIAAANISTRVNIRGDASSNDKKTTMLNVYGRGQGDAVIYVGQEYNAGGGLYYKGNSSSDDVFDRFEEGDYVYLFRSDFSGVGGENDGNYPIMSYSYATRIPTSQTDELGNYPAFFHVPVVFGSGSQHRISTDNAYNADGNGAFPQIIIHNHFEGVVDNQLTEDGNAGGGIRFVDNNSDNYFDVAFINDHLVFSHDGSNGNPEQIFQITETQGTNTFTGQHYNLPSTGEVVDYNNKIGYIVSSTGIYHNVNNDVAEALPTINEALPKVVLSTQPNDKKAFGVISDATDSNIHWAINGNTKSKIRKNDKRLVINSLGEGAIMVSNINGNLENGDYITTSAIEGLGMKQDDDLLHNYTVAKITQDCDFSSDTTDVIHDGQTYKMKLVGCTYHCG